ncbi:CBL-interacting serine/threonine-protein kinase 25-like [Salvia miltiorrhiza]|uniref:CBL-interacting serine/threonine-protein kinase 25-like n=1 Tax=Salvia miltiorrhiza TaxID=226208 RepID=UPI0025AC2E09|nr:CBL-interacting serine/threonine-protein kinase 25-like [Salvia miltiorrhiza]
MAAEAKKILFGKYEMGALLGRGAFAKVYLGRRLPPAAEETVAIKVIKKDEAIKSEKMMEQITREIAVMRRVRHPNVVELKEVMATRSKIFIVMEYAAGGALLSSVPRGRRLDEAAARRYFQQLVGAVDFCHSRGVFHRDIKPENLLLGADGRLKISDFGLSALYDNSGADGGGLLHTRCGTPAYAAPEVLRTKGYDGTKADIWSCGVVLYVLLAGFLPFDDRNLTVMFKKAIRSQYSFPPWFSTEAKRLVMKLLDPNPGKRISISGIMRVAWFKRGLQNPNSISMLEFTMLDDETEVTMIKKSPSSPAMLNAFQLISSMPTGRLDLSDTLVASHRRGDFTFTSRRSAKVTLGKIEMVGKKLGFRVARLKDLKLMLLGAVEGRKGRLSVTAEVFKVAPEVTVVEFTKVSGDTLECVRFREDDIRPGLKDIVWTWQGDSSFKCCDQISAQEMV